MKRSFRLVTTMLALGSVVALAACGEGSAGKNRPMESATSTVWQLPPEFTHTVSPTVTFTPLPENAASPTPTMPIVQKVVPVVLAAGWNFTCAINTEGAVMCWGRNSDGQLGDGTHTTRTKPVNVKGLSLRAVAVTTGAGHTCILTEEGGVKCWGRNEFGQLGNGTTERSSAPVDVSGLAGGVVAIAAGDDHTCAITAQGALKCWGCNKYGQLGDGTTDTQTTPVNVSGLSGVTAVAAGTGDTCVRTSGGEVLCWGNNDQGQLGAENDVESRAEPKAVGGLTGGIAALAAKGGHACILSDSGEIQCWGGNKFGQLGDGTFVGRSAPAPVTGLDGSITILAAGWSQTCAVLGDGRLKCWGWNFYGQLGEGSMANRNQPVDVIGLKGKVTAVAGGGGHTCAVLTTGQVFCWGFNENGQLGNQSNTDSSLPVKVIGITLGAAG
jgi:alpha-tubulin suppressor-like RCC1 family protein